MELAAAGITAGIYTIGTVIVKIAQKERNININKKNLQYHLIFVKLDNIILNDIKQRNFGNQQIWNTPYKKMIHDFLTTRLNIIKKNLKQLIKTEYLNKMSSDKLLVECQNATNGKLPKYKNFENSKHYHNIPKEFVHDYNDWDFRNKNIVLESIINISNNRFYSNNYAKVHAVFDIYLATLLSSLDNISNYLHLYLDKYKNCKYNGKKIKKKKIISINDKLNKKLKFYQNNINAKKKISSLLKNIEPNKSLNYNNLLLKTDFYGNITYVFNSFNNTFDYNILDIIGKNLLSISVPKFFQIVCDFYFNLKNSDKSEFSSQIYTKDRIILNIITKKYNNKLILTFITDL